MVNINTLNDCAAACMSERLSLCSDFLTADMPPVILHDVIATGDGAVYLFGGFNGVMNTRLLRVTLPTLTDCMRSAEPVRCAVYPSCSSCLEQDCVWSTLQAHRTSSIVYSAVVLYCKIVSRGLLVKTT